MRRAVVVDIQAWAVLDDDDRVDDVYIEYDEYLDIGLRAGTVGFTVDDDSGTFGAEIDVTPELRTHLEEAAIPSLRVRNGYRIWRIRHRSSAEPLYIEADEEGLVSRLAAMAAAGDTPDQVVEITGVGRRYRLVTPDPYLSRV